MGKLKKKKKRPGPIPDQLESQGVKRHTPHLRIFALTVPSAWKAILTDSLPLLHQVFLRYHFLNGASSDLFKLGRAFTPHFPGLIAHIILPCYTMHFLTMVIGYCLPPQVQESIISFIKVASVAGTQ